MRSFSTLVLAVALAAPLTSLLASPPAQGVTPTPSISSFTASPTGPLPYTGEGVTLSGSVANAATCTLSVTPSPSGSELPVAADCASGSVSDTVSLPENLLPNAVRYSFKLVAAMGMKLTHRVVVVEVDPPPLATITLLASPTTAFGGLGGPSTITAEVHNATTCDFTLSHGVVIPSTTTNTGPIDCASGSVSEFVNAPVNLDAYQRTYTITVSALNLSGKSVKATINLTDAPGSIECVNWRVGDCDDAYATLGGINLSGALFFEDNLTLIGDDMTGASLYMTDLQGANLSGVNLTDANLTDANLQGANLGDDTNLSGVIWNNTICPDGTNSNNDGGSGCDGHISL
jgi:Pentapeptide repeats (8 copies)